MADVLPILAQRLIHTATMLVVAHMERAVAFYRDQLGFVVQDESESITLLTLGAMNLYLITESPPTPDKPSVTLVNTNTPARTGVNLVFRVSGCHAVYEDMRAHGLAFLAPPHAPDWGGWRVFTRDPDGHLIEFEQP